MAGAIRPGRLQREQDAVIAHAPQPLGYRRERLPEIRDPAPRPQPRGAPAGHVHRCPRSDRFWRARAAAGPTGCPPPSSNQGWMSATDFDRFRSVHYPSDPMSLAEASAFIANLLKRWLASK